jgi:ankyrin repeat protein
LAGTQIALLKTLLEFGATLDSAGRSIVNSCLANGRAGAAEFLAERGARLDIEGAAGIGRLDIVQEYFHDDTGRKTPENQTALMSGFQWACEYGRTDVAEFLLARENTAAETHRGQTGLHWAAYGGHEEIVKLLLERKGPVDARDKRWRLTPLGWAIYGWSNPPLEANGARQPEAAARLVAAGSAVETRWILDAQADADPRMAAALRGETPAD